MCGGGGKRRGKLWEREDTFLQRAVCTNVEYYFVSHSRYLRTSSCSYYSISYSTWRTCVGGTLVCTFRKIERARGRLPHIQPL